MVKKHRMSICGCGRQVNSNIIACFNVGQDDDVWTKVKVFYRGWCLLVLMANAVVSAAAFRT